MKTRKLILGLFLVLTLVFFIFSLPRFSVTITDQTFTWPALDLSLFDITSPIGNFTMGSGLYGDRQITFTMDSSFINTADLVEALMVQDVNTVRSRLDKAGITDVDFNLERTTEDTLFVFRFPNYYSDESVLELGNLLVSPGKFEVLAPNPDTTQTADPVLGYAVTTLDVPASAVTALAVERKDFSVGSGSLVSIPGWNIKFATEYQDVLANALSTDSTTQQGLAIALDGNAEFYLQALDDSGLSFFGIPTQASRTLVDLRVLATYLLGQSDIKLSYVSPQLQQLQPVYGLEGKSYVAIAFILSAAIIGLWLAGSLTKKALGAFALSAAFYLFLATSLLKIAAVALSSGMILGFIAMYVIGISLILYVLQEEKKQEGLLNLVQTITGLIFLVTGVLYLVAISFGIYQEILGILAMMAVALYLTVAGPLKYKYNS